MRGWDWHGAVALILALSVGVGFAVAMVGATVQHEPISQQGAALLNTLGGALIGAVAGWLGGAAVERAQHHQEDTTMTTPAEPDEDTQPVVNDPATVPGAEPVQDSGDVVSDDGDPAPVEDAEPEDGPDTDPDPHHQA